jgi:hypothetical protein
VLDDKDFSTQDGGALQQWDWLNGANQQWALVVVPTVEVHNLTNPALAPNFLAGDTYEYVIRGLPSQPVTYVQNGGPLTSMGVTDGNGVLVVTGVEQTAWIGSYTQVWYVGGEMATPTLTFILDQLGSGGTLTNTYAAQTPDGSVIGISSISVANGAVTTYSATELSYDAQLYYDAQTVGSLVENGQTLQQGSDYQAGTAGGSLSVPAELMHSYVLQTDHYAVAYFVSGGYYQNPFYFQYGSSCEYSSDCAYWPNGGGSFYLVSAAIYLGSTLSNQSATPMTEADFVAVQSRLKNPSGLTSAMQLKVDLWASALLGAAKLSVEQMGKHPGAVLPGYLEVIGDCQQNGVGSRFRTYLLKDVYGHPWHSEVNPVLVGESVWPYPGYSVTGSGHWGSQQFVNPLDKMEWGSFTDDLAVGSSESKAIQQFWATNFSMPENVYPSLDPIFSLGSAPAKVPLAIYDPLSASIGAQGPRPTAGTWGSLDNAYTNTGISINNDGKVAPNYRFIYRSGQVGAARQSCY